MIQQSPLRHFQSNENQSQINKKKLKTTLMWQWLPDITMLQHNKLNVGCMTFKFSIEQQ
jgi:hypothetical protein